jgi:rod shape-determining protein MreC
MMLARTQTEMKQRAPWLFAGLLLFNLVLMGVDTSRRGMSQPVRAFLQAIVSPVQNVLSGIGNKGSEIVQNIKQMRQASAENEQLRQRLTQLESEANEARAAKAENERLKALLDFKNSGQYQMVTAQIISRDPTAWFNAVIINRGSSSGIKEGMPVVTPDGIVGRIIATSPWTSQVMLITDEKSAAGAVAGQLGISNAIGAIRGLGSDKGLVEMKYVSGLETVKVGEIVMTTGQDKIYPKGLKVGEVIEVIQGSATMNNTIRIKPSANINSLSEVAVLIYFAPEQPPMQQTLN